MFWKKIKHLLIVYFLVALFLGCASIEDPSPKSEKDVVVMEYAKKKNNVSRQELADEPGDLGEEDMYTFQELVALGENNRRQGNYPLALTYFQKALALKPHSIGVQRKIGDLFLERGMAEDAVQYYRQVVEKYPDYVPVLESLGQAKFYLGRMEEAKSLFLKTVALNPASWKGHSYLGMIYSLEGHFSKSLTEHKTALALKANIPELYNNVGVAYAQNGQYDKAEEFIQKAIKKGIKKEQAYNNLGLLIAKEENFPKAFEMFQKGESQGKALNNVGVVMLKRGYVVDAINCFERALQVEENFYKKAKSNLDFARQVLRDQIGEKKAFPQLAHSPCQQKF